MAREERLEPRPEHRTATVVDVEPKSVRMHGIKIRATEVMEDSKDRGIFTVYVPAREINTNEDAVLESLFPNTSVALQKLLKIEALMKAIQ